MDFELLVEEPTSVEHILVPYFEDAFTGTPWIPGTTISTFTGKANDLYSVLLHPEGRHVHLMGLGKETRISATYSAFRNVRNDSRAIDGRLLVDMRHLPQSIIYQGVLGLALSEYSIGAYKTHGNNKKSLTIAQLLVSEVNDQIHQLVNEAEYTASSIQRICKLIDAPSNIKTPQYLAQWALESGQEYGYKVEVLEKEALEKQGLQALLSVGQASENPPVLIKAEYHGQKQKSGFQVGLVGKGVTFDTGGISIKKAANMHYMKSDMAGAAAVMGAVELMARLHLPINIVAVIPIAENSLDGRSMRPGDVISSYSKKTIEVIDTDAEGRLILADALSYIQKNYRPDTVIDLATLTGSCVVALGYHAAGLFTNSDALATELSDAGEKVYERVWRLPLWENYKEDLESDVADVKNFSGKPVAGAIAAAKFLEYFIKDHPRWAHLDIAGVAFGDTNHAKMKSATGYGIRLLVDFVQSLLLSSKP